MRSPLSKKWPLKTVFFDCSDRTQTDEQTSDFPTALANGTEDLSPLALVTYLKELAADFHSFCNEPFLLIKIWREVPAWDRNYRTE